MRVSCLVPSLVSANLCVYHNALYARVCIVCTCIHVMQYYGRGASSKCVCVHTLSSFNSNAQQLSVYSNTRKPKSAYPEHCHRQWQWSGVLISPGILLSHTLSSSQTSIAERKYVWRIAYTEVVLAHEILCHNQITECCIRPRSKSKPLSSQCSILIVPVSHG